MDPGTGSGPHHRQLTSGKDTWSAGCAERCTPGAGGGPRETTGGNADTAPVGLPHSVWFKGGSEPGVLTLGYLAINGKGQTFLVVAVLNDTAAALSPSAGPGLLAIVRGAFELVR